MSDFHQQLMDEAYDLWQKNEDWSYLDFLNNLDELHKQAVVIGNLNYQVENGGFLQWHDNGYTQAYDEVIKTLEDFINYDERYMDIGTQIRDIVEYVMNIFESDEFKVLDEYDHGIMERFYKVAYDNQIIDFQSYAEARDKFFDKYEDACEEEFNNWLYNIESEAIKELENYVFRLLDNMNTKYYTINDKFLELFNEYLTRLANNKMVTL